AGGPAPRMLRQLVAPKQPNRSPLGLVGPGQKFPVALFLVEVPVWSGERLMPITPTCEPSQQLPPPAVQGQLQRIWQVSPAVVQSALVVHAVPAVGWQIL